MIEAPKILIEAPKIFYAPMCDVYDRETFVMKMSKWKPLVGEVPSNAHILRFSNDDAAHQLAHVAILTVDLLDMSDNIETLVWIPEQDDTVLLDVMSSGSILLFDAWNNSDKLPKPLLPMCDFKLVRTVEGAVFAYYTGDIPSKMIETKALFDLCHTIKHSNTWISQAVYSACPDVFPKPGIMLPGVPEDVIVAATLDFLGSEDIHRIVRALAYGKTDTHTSELVELIVDEDDFAKYASDEAKSIWRLASIIDDVSQIWENTIQSSKIAYQRPMESERIQRNIELLNVIYPDGQSPVNAEQSFLSDIESLGYELGLDYAFEAYFSGVSPDHVTG